MGPKPCPPPMPLWGFWLCKGVKDCPSLLRPLLPGFCSLFLAVNYAKGVGKGRVGGGKQGGNLKDWGDWACKEGAIPVPLRPAAALSHGVLEKKGRVPDWLARPWGQRAGPAQLGSAAPSPASLPSRVPGQGMSCSRRSLPGARGQGGPGGVVPSPSHLLPAQVRAGAATAAAPDSRRPRAGGTQGVGPGEGLGEPRQRWRHLAAVPCAGRGPGSVAPQLVSVRPLAKAPRSQLVGPLGRWAAVLWEGHPFPRPLPAGLPSGQRMTPLL